MERGGDRIRDDSFVLTPIVPREVPPPGFCFHAPRFQREPSSLFPTNLSSKNFRPCPSTLAFFSGVPRIFFPGLDPFLSCFRRLLQVQLGEDAAAFSDVIAALFGDFFVRIASPADRDELFFFFLEESFCHSPELCWLLYSPAWFNARS